MTLEDLREKTYHISIHDMTPEIKAWINSMRSGSTTALERFLYANFPQNLLIDIRIIKNAMSENIISENCVFSLIQNNTVVLFTGNIHELLKYIIGKCEC